MGKGEREKERARETHAEKKVIGKKRHSSALQVFNKHLLNECMI